MIRSVHRAVRAGIGGGASQEPFPHSTTTTPRSTTGNNRNQPINTTLSHSSNNNNNPSPCSYLNHPVPAAAPPNWECSASPTTTEEFDWECIEGGGSDGESLNGVYDDFVFGGVPSKDEVHHAVSSLQEVVEPISFSQLMKDRMDIEKIPSGSNIQKFGSESDWMEPSLEVCNSRRMLQLVPTSSRSVCDAFHLLQTEPSVQRMVISLSSDKAVWDAVMNNEVVRELRESIDEDESISKVSEDDVDGSNPVKQVLRWIFVNTKQKVVEIVEKITKIVNELIQPMNKDDDRKPKREGCSTFEEKLRSSFLLSVMVLLIVVVSRTRKC